MWKDYNVKFVDMLMIYRHTKFSMRNSIHLLVIAIETKVIDLA